MSKRELLELLSGFGFIEDIILHYENNTIEVKLIKPYPKIVVLNIKYSPLKPDTIPSSVIFIKILSKMSLERKFSKLREKFLKHGLGFSVNFGGSIKHGFDYQVSIFRSKGSTFLKEKFPIVSDFFQIDFCTEISWKIDEYGDINFEIK